MQTGKSDAVIVANEAFNPINESAHASVGGLSYESLGNRVSKHVNETCDSWKDRRKFGHFVL